MALEIQHWSMYSVLLFGLHSFTTELSDSKSQGNLESLVEYDEDDESYQEKIIIYFWIKAINSAEYAN